MKHYALCLYYSNEDITILYDVIIYRTVLNVYMHLPIYIIFERYNVVFIRNIDIIYPFIYKR